MLSPDRSVVPTIRFRRVRGFGGKRRAKTGRALLKLFTRRHDRHWPHRG
jgi:hypothetical protein